jgi:PDZ domain-containing protein
VTVAAVTAIGLLYHPPVGVLVAGPPVDVVGDIVVIGAAVDRPSGRYLMTWVDVERPTAFGTLVALARHRTVLATHAADGGGIDRRTAARLGHQAFEDSRRHAVAAAEKALGLAPGTLHVAFRARAVSGPSAGLVYALALVDLLDGVDLAHGRVIAATGQIEEGGEVAPVGFVRVKSGAFRAGRAVLILVPDGQAGEVRAHAEVRGVSSLQDALRILRGD